jgi:hypothetical protein
MAVLQNYFAKEDPARGKARPTLFADAPGLFSQAWQGLGRPSSRRAAFCFFAQDFSDGYRSIRIVF